MKSEPTTTPADPCLSVRGLWKVFGNRTQQALELADTGASRSDVQAATGATIGVRDASFDVAPSETFVIMGLSGSGKSTLLRCVARLTDISRGEILLEGDPLHSVTDTELRSIRRAKMSMVFQHFGLWPHRRVIDNVAYGLEIQGVDKATRHARALDAIETVGLGSWHNHYPSQLSGGMQQRVGLARALVVDPTIMFFDEPFSALDPLIRREMQDELLRLQNELNRTIVFVTHDFDEAIRLGDRIAVMKDGEFDQVGTAAELITAPATDYVAEFVKDVSRSAVLSAADVMVAPDSIATATRTVDADAKLDTITALLIGSTDAIGVVRNGEVIGQVDRQRVADLIAP